MNPPTTRSLAVLFLVLAMGSALNRMADDGTGSSRLLYRNGGQFGLADSDIELRGDGLGAAPTNTDPEPAPVAYTGTLHLNGGHYGEANGDLTQVRDSH